MVQEQQVQAPRSHANARPRAAVCTREKHKQTCRSRSVGIQQEHHARDQEEATDAVQQQAKVASADGWVVAVKNNDECAGNVHTSTHRCTDAHEQINRSSDTQTQAQRETGTEAQTSERERE